MRLNRVILEHFRNYAAETFDFDPQINLICGANAQGKTNLLEACALLSTMKLFRTGQKKEGLAFGQTDGRVQGDFEAEGQPFTLEVRLHASRAMEIFRSGARLRRQSEGQGLLKTVLFCPDDLYLIRAGAASRRKFLDMALTQLRPNYGRYLEEYNKVLEHKTRILRDSEERPDLLALYDDFSLRQARLGASLVRYRASYLRKLGETAARVHREIAPGEQLELEYATIPQNPFGTVQQVETELQEHLFRHKQAEIASRSCLSGCHKDDILITVNGNAASKYGSQGQVRTCALVLKLSERELVYEDCGEYPVLLLDDVLSELDKRRQDFVLNRIQAGQVLITCCEEEAAGKLAAGRVFAIENGRIRE